MRAALFLTLLLAATARAADADKFLEAAEAGDWAAAERAWSDLASNPQDPPSVPLVLRHAEVLVRLNRRDAARADAERVLDKEPRNVLALSLLARLRGGDEAKDLLLQAAREGFPVLREVRGAKELTGLLDQPSFVLAVLRAPTEGVEAKAPRNPFSVPRVGAEATPPRTPTVVNVPPKEPRRRLEEYIRLANEHLRAMRSLLRDEKLAEVSARFLEVSDLADQMRKEPEEDFTRVAEELVLRGSRLDAEARKLLNVRDLGITVTGIVVAPSVKNRAIVALGTEPGKIYEEGDELRDSGGARVRGLKVARIAEGTVSFTYEDVSFVRELRRGP